MVKKPTGFDNSKPPDEFAQAAPRDLHPTSDIRFVMVETAKLTAEVKGLETAVKEHAADIKELRNWIIGGLLAVGAAGAGAVIWANNKFEDNAKQQGELSKGVAVMQTQTSAMQDDIKDIKNALIKERDEKTNSK